MGDRVFQKSYQQDMERGVVDQLDGLNRDSQRDAL